MFSENVGSYAQAQGAASVVISAKIEAEVSQLEDAEEKQEFLEAIGLKETGLDRLIRAGYELLDLITYFTAGPNEARAWTVQNGSRAPEAAGRIHTDFEKGFICAETIAGQRLCRTRWRAGLQGRGKNATGRSGLSGAGRRRDPLPF